MPNAKPTPTPAPTAGKAAGGDSTAAAAAAPPAPAVATGSATSQKAPIPAAAFDMPKPNQRGLNKPKCIQCGNVARSRCPFQCCKACCFKAQNPCHIHVLKQTNPLPDKPSPTTAPISEHPSTNSLLTGSVSRLTSLQRLPHHFLSALRAKKSLDEKDIESINEWRFMKLKEHMQGEIDAENEAYERYTQNAGLLEEAFFPTATEDAAVEPEAEKTFSERLDMLISEAIVRLKSDKERSESYKERLGTILDQKLKELRESETAFEDQMSSVQKADDHTEVKFTTKQKMERNAKYNDLIAKMLMASCEDDLKPCREIAVELFGDKIDPPMDYKSDQVRLSPPSAQGSSAAAAPPGPFPKLCIRREVDEDFAAKVNKEFESLSDIAQL